MTKLEKALLERPWQAVCDWFDVKLLPDEQELYVLARRARIDKECTMRPRKLKWLWGRLKELGHAPKRDELLMKLGAARGKARAAWRLVDIEVDPQIASFSYTLNRDSYAKCAARVLPAPHQFHI